MSKAKKPSASSGQGGGLIEVKEPPKPPVSKFSKFGGFNPGIRQESGQANAPKSVITRPTFVTQHKGGGGK